MTDQLPSTWTIATLEELLAPLKDGRLLHHGWSPQCEREPAGSDQEWGVLKTTAIQPGAFHPEHNKKLPSGLAPRPQHEVQVGDLLITCAGPRVRCGIPCLVKSTRPKLMLSGKMYRFRVPDRFVDSEYIEKYLLSQKAQRAIDAMKTGGNESGLNLTHDRFKPLPVPLAPINEQRRIASKIDELFSRIDEGERALQRASVLIERYRQSVLKAAVTGELTRAWREKKKDTPESGEFLLARILAARRAAWEKSRLDRMKTKGQTSSNGKWKQKYEEPSSPDVGALPELPEGWVWGSFSQLFVVASDEGRRLKEREYATSGVLAVIDQGSSFVSGWTDRRDLAFSGPLPVIGFGDHTRRFKLIDFPFVVGADGLKLFHSTRGYSSSFALIALGASQFEDRGYSRHFQFLKNVVLPVPPESEQAEIVEVYSRLSSQADALVNQLNREVRRINTLRQSILKAAFSGRLVGQDPADEPASMLLERIAAERGAHTAAPKRGRKRKKTA